MRASFTFAVLAAGAYAVPQSYSVQPITQISDGQIQAPPATAAPSSVAAPTSVAVETSVVVVPSSAPVVVPSSAPVVVPSVSAPVVVPSANVSAPVVSSAASAFPNSTIVLSTSAGTGPTSGAGAGPSAPAGTGAANANMVNMASFGGLALAIAGLLA